VIYHAQQDSSGRPYTSTLAELLAFFHLDRSTAIVFVSKRVFQQPALDTYNSQKLVLNPDPQRSQWGRIGRNVRLKKELAAMHRLEELRGGFRKYQRRNAVFVQSILLAALGQDHQEIVLRALALGSRCRPPLAVGKCLKMADLDHVLKYSHFPWTRRKILFFLLVTTPELSAIPEWCPKPSRRQLQTERTERRRALIKKYFASSGPCSLAKMRRLLQSAGHSVSRETVRQDYKALGLTSNGQCGRPSAKSREPSPPHPSPTTLGSLRLTISGRTSHKPSPRLARIALSFRKALRPCQGRGALAATDKERAFHSRRARQRQEANVSKASQYKHSEVCDQDD